MRPDKLLLWGPMGSGKSTVAPLVARSSSAALFDLDEAIVSATGLSIARLFAERGEAEFRSIERATLERILSIPGPAVIALGGGALLDASFRRNLLESSCIVALCAKPDVLASRASASDRPLLQGSADRTARLEAIVAARREAYAEAHSTIDTSVLSPPDVAVLVQRAWSLSRAVMPLGSRTYAIDHEPVVPALERAIADLAPSSVVLVSDEAVCALWGARIVAALTRCGQTPIATVIHPPSEASKTLAAVERGLVAMMDAGADRGSLVVALGGGVVTDIAGFTAAVFMRGVRWLAIPTTLLGMVDASVGGKTGVDLGGAKNAVGAFHQPSRVIVDVEHCTTESDRAFRSGLAEIVKAGCIGDATLFADLQRGVGAILARDRELVGTIVTRALAVKTRIVSADEREGGVRALLNFGHTIGHALEAHGDFARLTHGEAVALGIASELRIGVSLGITPPEVAAQTIALLEALGLSVNVDATTMTSATSLIAKDKKRIGARVKLVLVRALGGAELVEMPVDEVRRLAIETVPPT